MTPAEMAREYAAKHGFTIHVTDRRRYEVREGDRVVADVWGYPLALQRMQMIVGERPAPKPVDNVQVDCVNAMVRGAQFPSMDHYREMERSRDERMRNDTFVSGLSFGPRDVVDGQIVRGVAHVTRDNKTEHRAFGMDDPTRPIGVTPQEWAEYQQRPRQQSEKFMGDVVEVPVRVRDLPAPAQLALRKFAFMYETPRLRKPKSWPNTHLWAVRVTGLSGLMPFDQPVSNRKEGMHVIRSVAQYWRRRGATYPQMQLVYVGDAK